MIHKNIPLHAIALAVLTASCTTVTQQEGHAALGNEDSTAIDNASFFEKLNDLQDDSTAYLGEIYSLETPGEFYTPVYYHRQIDPSAYHLRVSECADSVIFQDDEMKRSRLPYKIAKRIFNLSGLDQVSIYEQGRHLSEAKFVGVDLLEGIIGSQFIAVFRLLSGSDSLHDRSYCISSDRKVHLKPIPANFSDVTDDRLTSNICKTLGVSIPGVEKAVHIKMADNKIYSAISLNHRAFLIETDGNQSQILKEIKEDYYLIDITPVHFSSNGKPMFLIQMGANETDMIWTSLAIFTGNEYEFAERNRIRP